MIIDNLEHEERQNNGHIPISLFKRTSDKTSIGCRFHWHENIEIFYCVSGGVELLNSGHHFLITKGDIAIVNWCEPHRSLSFLDGTVHYIIHVDLQSPIFSGVDFSLITPPTIIKENNYINSHLNNMIDLYTKNSEQNSCAIIGDMYCILGEILKHSQPKQSKNRQDLIYTKEALQYIHENACKPIKISELASHLSISESHLCRVFKAHTGKTIIQYSNLIKFDLAIGYIKKGYKISDVSSMVGFEDYNYFSRIFKKVTGLSPTDYKN